MSGAETVNAEANSFYAEMAKLVDAFVAKAQDFAEPLRKDVPQVAQRAEGTLFMLNEKVKEAMHRVGDLCAVAAQSSRAAGEIVGAKS